MPYLLNFVYLALLLVFWPWLIYQSIRKGKYRQGFAAKFFGMVPRREKTSESTDALCLWLHAVSVGEVNLLATLIEHLARVRPGWQCVVSTTTKTGYALAKSKYSHLTVFYCPLDFSWAVRRAMRRIRPDMLVLAELELWPNLIRAAKNHGAKVVVINGRLSNKSFRGYRRLRPLVARVLRQIDLVAAQNQQYAERFIALGASAAKVFATGSLKYDGAQTDRNNPATRHLAQLAGFETLDKIFLAGSTQEHEEALCLETFRQWHERYPHLRLVLVPRHPDRFDAVAKMLNASGLAWRRRSELEQRQNQRARILLVDAVGELGAWWGTAQIAFVGGSLGNRGGQNMIEPAAYGAAVSFGPKTWNFRDIVSAMLDQQAAVVVEDGYHLTRFVGRCLRDSDYQSGLGRRAYAFVASQLGATQRTGELIQSVLEKTKSNSPSDRAAA